MAEWNSRDYAIDSLLLCIDRMSKTVSDVRARVEAGRDRRESVASLVTEAMSTIAWGWANAQMDAMTAIRHITESDR